MATTRDTEFLGPVEFGPFRFEPGNGLWRDADEVALPPRALAVLTTLVAQPGTVVSKAAIMDAVWKDAFVTEASLLEAVGVLREALGDDRLHTTYIQTVHRRGYRFIAATTPAVQDGRIPGCRPGRDSGSGHESGSGVDVEVSPDVEASMTWGPQWRPLVVAAVAATTAIVGIAI